MSKLRRYRHLTVSVVALVAVFLFAWWYGSIPGGAPWGRDNVSLHSLVTEEGEIILQTSLPVRKGDVFITADNRKFTAVAVRDGVAQMRFDGYEPMPQGQAGPDHATLLTAAGLELGGYDRVTEAMPEAGGARLVVLYHTHSDESYIPGDGLSNAPGNGGIYKVGDALAASLQADGWTVYHNLANHNPHDAMAYTRSRRTVFQDLKLRPFALFDVHRDAGPSAPYDWSYQGQPASKVLLVVGRQNPMEPVNMFLAQRLKGVADYLYPGLVSGIFIAHGNYNQDLDPGALLLEFGTEQTARTAAEKGAAVFGHVISATLGPAR